MYRSLTYRTPYTHTNKHTYIHTVTADPNDLTKTKQFTTSYKLYIHKPTHTTDDKAPTTPATPPEKTTEKPKTIEKPKTTETSAQSDVKTAVKQEKGKIDHKSYHGSDQAEHHNDRIIADDTHQYLRFSVNKNAGEVCVCMYVCMYVCD